MKVQKVSQSVTPFAGISFVNQEFNDSGLLNLINKHLGIRSLTGYQYGEIFHAWFDVFFCGGEVAEDIQKYLRPTLEDIPSNSVPSQAETLERAYRLLADNKIEINRSRMDAGSYSKEIIGVVAKKSVNVKRNTLRN